MTLSDLKGKVIGRRNLPSGRDAKLIAGDIGDKYIRTHEFDRSSIVFVSTDQDNLFSDTEIKFSIFIIKIQNICLVPKRTVLWGAGKALTPCVGQAVDNLAMSLESDVFSDKPGL